MTKKDSSRGAAAVVAGGAAEQRTREPRASGSRANATADYAARFDPRYATDFYRPVFDGALVSSIGIGTYLGECSEEDDAGYRDAVTHALGAGVNLVDTAINYRCQRSELAVGAAVQRAITAGATREAMIICTKGGYLPMSGRPPATREEYQAFLKNEFFDTGILTIDDLVGGGHSMAPSFLRYAMARSRKNLGLRTIDVYYLHNPEHQAAVVSPESFRERMRAAFMVLEDAATRGEIGVYGVATWNGLRVPPKSKSHVSLGALVAIARDVAGEGHHFGAVQMPINLAMTEAVRLPTQPVGNNGALVPAVEAASALGLAVFASAALMQAQLTKDLPESVRTLFPVQRTDAQRALAFVRSVPGVTAALVGTKSIAHLEENLESAKR
jgi:aryl-alcohol dehydrogenase-like predicted oxidoreductase